MTEGKGHCWVCQVHVVCVCWDDSCQHGLDRSGGVDSEGEVDMWLSHVARQWCVQVGWGGWLTTSTRGHGIGSRVGVIY